MATDSDLLKENERLRERIAELEAASEKTHRELHDLGQLYQTAPVGLCLVDPDLRYVRINDLLASVNGRSVEDHLGATVGEMVPQIRDVVEPFFRQVLETGESILGVEVSGTPLLDPSSIWYFIANYHPITNDQGKVVGVSTVIQNITDLKIAEKKLLESETRVRLLLDSTAEAIYGLDLNGNCTFCNPACVKILGFSDSHDLLGKNMHDLIHHSRNDGSAYPMETCRIYEAFRFGKGSHVDDEVLWKADGSSFPAEYWSYPVREGDELVGSVVAFLDITARKAAENDLQQAHNELESQVTIRTAELAASEERWRSLISTAPELIMTVDPEGTLTYVNLEVQGFSIDQVMGLSIYALVREEYRGALKECVESVFRDGEIREVEAAVDGPDGSTEWYVSRLGPLRKEGKIESVIGIATNITRRKQMEQHLLAEERLMRNLWELQERERKTVASEIHDGFVQYTVGAHMHLESIASSLEPQNNKMADDLQAVQRLLQQAMTEGRRMISDLRPMIIDERGILLAIDFLIADLECTSSLKITFHHNVQFFRLDPMLESTIFRIVQEGLNNIKRHAATDQVIVQLTQQDGHMTLEIEDQGAGFNPSEVTGERFGLRSIRERCRLFGGKATITSTPGNGTTIHATLPVLKRPDSLEADEDIFAE